MNKKEKVGRDIGLTFDFLRQVVDNPKLVENIPNGSTLEFVEKDFPKREKSGFNAKNHTFLMVKSELELVK